MPIINIISRVSAPFMFTFLLGKWGYKDILSRGHKVIEISFSDPTRQPVGSKNIVPVKLGTQIRKLTIMHKPGVQISGLKGLSITCADDLDSIWPYFSSNHKELVNNLKPLNIISMTTINKHGATCLWRRTNVGKKGGNIIHKLLLVSINGKDTADISLPTQIKHADKMYVDKCDLEQYTVQATACRKALKAAPKTKRR